jgi:glycosyltransferase involved in cell wall biosynthesis
MESNFQLTENSKPNVLHVLHSWGGGIDFFARDLQAGDHHRNHYFLKSHSRDSLPPYGKELCLYHSMSEDPLGRWLLSDPIADTQLHSVEVLQVLQSIIEKWAIGAVIVSSLIGHSLDVLKTGLPTALAVHDVYPFWPLLHDGNTDDYSNEYLFNALKTENEGAIFSAHEAEYWLAIRRELITAIEQKNIICVAPSVFAKDRVCRIEPLLNRVQWQVIPHGIDRIIQGIDTVSLKEPRKLRVLVPGHINGAKGETLLRELIPNLPAGIELVLLGSAHLGEQFRCESVSAIASYRREELCAIVRHINADVALLASTVPETYGYVMSEMLQLGMPVLCSDIGAYAERGKQLPGVRLVRPNTPCFLDALVEMRDDPGILDVLRENLPVIFPGLDQMADEWALVLPAKLPQWQFDLTDDPGIANEVMMNLQLTHMTEILKQLHAATENNTQASAEAIRSIQQQQTNIGNILESLAAQNRQINALQAEQNALRDALLNKQQEIDLLKTFAEEQKLLLDRIGLAFEEKTDAIRQELVSMQAKRGWRFLSFFK